MAIQKSGTHTSLFCSHKLHPYHEDYFIMTNPISSFDPNVIALLTEKLEKLQKLQDLMKSANKIIRKKAFTDERKVVELREQLGFTEERAKSLVFKPDFAGRFGFPDYEITNNGATIRTVKARITELSAIAPQTERFQVESHK